jgi:hypothetical protein
VTALAAGSLAPRSPDQEQLVTATTGDAYPGERLDFIRWRIERLFVARGVRDWSTIENAQYQALTDEEHLLLGAR